MAGISDISMRMAKGKPWISDLTISKNTGWIVYSEERHRMKEVSINRERFRSCKMKIFFLIPILFFLYSCRKDSTPQNQELIIGEWKAIDKNRNHVIYRHGYQFLEDNLCIDNIGFYSYFINEGFLLHTPHTYCLKSGIPHYLFGGETELNNVNHYFGNRTSYKIEDDTLKIYDPAKNAWQSQHIRFVSPDTMILSSVNECRDSIYIPFVRKIYQTDDKPLFDRLIFYTPYGVWSDKMFYIEQDGTFISYGYKGENEFFVGKMKEGEFERIENLFRKSDLNNLAMVGGASFSSFEPKIIFIRDYEMMFVSSMMVPEENKEYYWAYLTALFSPYDIYVKPAGKNDHQVEFLKLTDLYSYKLKGTDRKINLHRIELFYLNILLSRANESTTRFEPVYRLISGDRQIATDGRYYLLPDQEGNQKVLDIGFNFVEDIQREYINPPEGNTIEVEYKSSYAYE